MKACDVTSLKLVLNASIGIAIYSDDGQSAQELFKKADFAMYAAKKQKQPSPLKEPPDMN